MQILFHCLIHEVTDNQIGQILKYAVFLCCKRLDTRMSEFRTLV